MASLIHDQFLVAIAKYLKQIFFYLCLIHSEAKLLVPLEYNEQMLSFLLLLVSMLTTLFSQSNISKPNLNLYNVIQPKISLYSLSLLM